MIPQKESRPHEGDGNQAHTQRGIDSSLTDVSDVWANLEAAVIGYALHVGNVDQLPPAHVFHPGTSRALATLLHDLARTGQPVDPFTAKLRLARDKDTPRAHYDALVAAYRAGTETQKGQAHYYAKELRAEARRRTAQGHLTRALQLLEAAEDAAVIDQLADALNVLGGVAA